MVILGSYCHCCQIQAPAVQHGCGDESITTAQWIGQMLRAAWEALAGTYQMAATLDFSVEGLVEDSAACLSGTCVAGVTVGFYLLTDFI